MHGTARGVAPVLAMLVLLAMNGAAAGASAARHRAPEVWTVGMTAEETYVDNFFEEGPQGGSKPDAFTTLRASLQRDAPPRSILPGTITVGIGGENYSRFEQANHFFYSFQAERKLGRLTPALYYRGSPSRLLFISEQTPAGLTSREKNVLYSQNVVGAEITRRFLPAQQLRLSLGFETELRDFQPPFNGRDSTSYEPRFGARLSAWPLFTPRIGVGYKIENARAPRQERRGVKGTAGFDSRWTDAVSWGFRWDFTQWRYNAAPARNRNFRRRDERNAFLVHASVQLPRAFSLSVRYRFLDGGSTRQDREFTQNEVSAGLTYAF